MNLSVTICTHNPRRDYLDRVLRALQEQTLPLQQWELLLIDNASDRLLESEIDLTWHPKARHIREEQLGLTSARLRGIKESIGDVLVFVDDDNVLDEDYLEAALCISKNWPILGAWGGQIRPEFEEPPPEWTKPYWGMLAIRHNDRDRWSNLPRQNEATPCGAGLCVRKMVAEKYSDLVRLDIKRLKLDRSGKVLTSCGDSDLAFTACDMGFGTGVFIHLRMMHLIPPYRLQEDYLLKLVEGIEYSATILSAIRGQEITEESRSSRIFTQYKRWRMDPLQRRFFDASQAGKMLAIRELRGNQDIMLTTENHKARN